MSTPAPSPSWGRPAGVGFAAVLMLAAAAVLWTTAARPAAVPLTSVELGVALSLVGGFLLGRRPGHRIAALLAGTGLLFCLATLAAAALDHGMGGAAGQAALAVAWLAGALPVPWMLLVLWFPDGCFLAPGWRRTFAVLGSAAVAAGLAGYLFGPPGRLPAILTGARIPAGLAGPFADPGHGWLVGVLDAGVLLPVVALPALVNRFRRGDPVVRQQIRWLLTAVVVTVGLSALGSVLEHGPAVASALGTTLSAVAQPLPSVAIAFAVLRYRLWDIDIVVSRALVYGALWFGLSVLLLLPALLSGYLVGGPAALGAVGAALLVTLVFQPVQRRLQRLADARVYGRRRRGLQELARVGEMLRDAAHLDEAGPRVAGTLQEALHVPWATVWVHVRSGAAEGLRPVGSAGAEALPLRLPAPAAAALRAHPHARLAGDLPEALRGLVPGPAGALAPLVVAGELVGLLACGERPREPLEAADLEPLDRFAGECALGLRGLRLDAELRVRLEEIEEQAAELRSSRQRLVRAQDDERRRIERNLHDGVQQQLVGLAARLRRLAGRVDAAHRPDCVRLADDAEETVFALQDVARGIFPAVLADQGLAVALRAHAGRTPLPVHVEIEPRLASRRVHPEAEAALYYVALEALTNVAKHAPDATASLTLRTDEAGRQLVLEVHDDGPGLPRVGRREGTGLVNMRDRVSAVGGDLRVDSRAGAGTWVRAWVPLSYSVVELRPAEADSRR